VPAIELERITKVFDGSVTAVDDVSLTVADGEFMVLVGPSGCGKSTLLRLIAGLEKVTAGRILIGDEDVTALGPPDRDLAMVFQTYALYPHKSVRENLAFGLRRRKVSKDEITERVDRMAAMLGLGEMMERRPAALSGGQRQRVAMGRALVREPRAFLLDEPLSNLDAKLRTSMRGELARLHERLPTTTVYVTHDQVEAMTLGERVAVLRDGVVQQCDVPQRLFDHPANVFVGAFIGSPAMNLVEAELGTDSVSFGATELRLEGLEPPEARGVVLGIRPTSFAVAGPSLDPSWPRLRVVLDVVEQLGSECNLLFPLDAPPVMTEDVKAAIGGESGSDEGRLLADDDRARFTARIPGRPPAPSGGTVELAIDPSQLYVFDRESGRALEIERPSLGAAQHVAEGIRG
jgi:multiple sugar transport system ATP-binding protein